MRNSPRVRDSLQTPFLRNKINGPFLSVGLSVASLTACSPGGIDSEDGGTTMGVTGSETGAGTEGGSDGESGDDETDEVEDDMGELPLDMGLDPEVPQEDEINYVQYYGHVQSITPLKIQLDPFGPNYPADPQGPEAHHHNLAIGVIGGKHNKSKNPPCTYEVIVGNLEMVKAPEFFEEEDPARFTTNAPATGTFRYHGGEGDQSEVKIKCGNAEVIVEISPRN